MLVAAAVFLDAPLGARLSDVAAGVAVVLLSFPRGPVRDRYGSWDRLVR